MQRIAPVLIGLALGGYASVAAIGLIRLDWSDPIQTEGSGILFLFAACAGFMAVGFLAKPAFFPSASLGRFGLRTFAVAWFLAMLGNLAITSMRTKPDIIRSPWDLAIAVISWTVVTLIFSVPTLIALLILRITRPST